MIRIKKRINMKKIILTLALLTLAPSIAHSEETEPDLMEAPAEYVMGLLRLCKSYATDDVVLEVKMTNYLLTCINDELEESDYKRITTLPIED